MTPWQSMALTVLASVLASGGLWSFIQYRLQRHDKIHESLDAITKSIKQLDDKVDENDAKTARENILRFSDELQNNVWHSQDYYRQVFDSINRYERYCDTHKEFPNGFTEPAINYIKGTYQKLLENHEFERGDKDETE